jgi:hypothetical protein
MRKYTITIELEGDIPSEVMDQLVGFMAVQAEALTDGTFTALVCDLDTPMRYPYTLVDNHWRKEDL